MGGPFSDVTYGGKLCWAKCTGITNTILLLDLFVESSVGKMQRNVEDIQQEIDAIRGRPDFLDRPDLVRRATHLETMIQGIFLFVTYFE